MHNINYLVSPIETVTLNLSRPAGPVIAQYFDFVHHGLEGFRKMIGAFLENARLLSRRIEETGWFVCISDIHRSPSGVLDVPAQCRVYPAGIPLVVFRLDDHFAENHPEVKQNDICAKMRNKGSLMPSKRDTQPQVLLPKTNRWL